MTVNKRKQQGKEVGNMNAGKRGVLMNVYVMSTVLVLAGSLLF